MVESPKNPQPSRVPRSGWFLLGSIALGAVGLLLLRRSTASRDVPATIEVPSTTSSAITGDVGSRAPTESSASPDRRSAGPAKLAIPIQIYNPTYSQIRFAAQPNAVLAIGSEGSIVRSVDDGESWIPVETGTREYLLDSVVVAEGKGVVVVGSRGTLLRSENGGANFTKVVVSTERAFRAVAAFDEMGQVLGVGDDGMAYFSSDGGRSFTAETTGTANYLSHVVGVPGKNRFVIGGDLGTISVREGSGKYHSAKTPAKMLITALDVMQDGTIVAGSQDGYVLRSSDAGDSFDEVYKMREDMFVIGFDRNATGDVLLGRLRTREILESRDNGRRFAQLAFEPKQGLSKLVWVDERGFVGLGLQGAIVSSDVLAKNWSIRSAPHLANPAATAIHPKSKSMIAVGASGLIARSTDQGKSFDVVRPSFGGLLRAMAWDESRGCIVAVGFDATILRSDDGGEKWAPVGAPVDAKAEFHAAVFESKTGAFLAATHEGAIVRSTDCGRRWTLTRAPTKKAIFALLATGNGGVLAMAADSPVLRSTDGGMTFGETEMEANANPRRAVVVESDAVIVAVGNDGRIDRSTDAGRTWQRIATNTTAHLRAVQVDPSTREVWTVGDNGTVLRSRDAGASWSAHRVPTTENLFVVAFDPRGPLTWIGGNRGTVLRSEGRDRDFASVDSGSTQTIRTIVLDPKSNEFFVAGAGGTMLRTVEGKRLVRVDGAYEGRVDAALFHPPSGSLFLAGDRLYRIGGSR